MNKTKGIGPSREQTSQQMCALLVSVNTARFQGSIPERQQPVGRNAPN